MHVRGCMDHLALLPCYRRTGCKAPFVPCMRDDRCAGPAAGPGSPPARSAPPASCRTGSSTPRLQYSARRVGRYHINKHQAHALVGGRNQPEHSVLPLPVLTGLPGAPVPTHPTAAAPTQRENGTRPLLESLWHPPDGSVMTTMSRCQGAPLASCMTRSALSAPRWRLDTRNSSSCGWSGQVGQPRCSAMHFAG